MDRPGSSHGPGIAGSSADGMVRLCLRSTTRRARRASFVAEADTVRAVRTPLLSLAASAVVGADGHGRRVHYRNHGGDFSASLRARTRVGSGSRCAGLLFGRSRGAAGTTMAAHAVMAGQQGVAGRGAVRCRVHFAGVVAASCDGGTGIFPLVVLDSGGLFRRACMAQLQLDRSVGIG